MLPKIQAIVANMKPRKAGELCEGNRCGLECSKCLDREKDSEDLMRPADPVGLVPDLCNHLAVDCAGLQRMVVDLSHLGLSSIPASVQASPLDQAEDGALPAQARPMHPPKKHAQDESGA